MLLLYKVESVYIKENR